MNDRELPLLTVVEGTGAAALDHARFLAEGVVEVSCQNTDLVVVNPADGKWVVAAVERVLGVTQLMPAGGVGVVVLDTFDGVAARAADRLLLAAEDVGSLWRIVLVTSDAGCLPPTLLGRCGRVERVGGVGTPLPDEVAAVMLSVCLPRVDPVAEAVRVDADVAEAAQGCPVGQRPRVRRLAASAVLDVWEQQLVAELPAVDPARACDALASVGAARKLLSLNGDPLLALVAAAVAVSGAAEG